MILEFGDWVPQSGGDQRQQQLFEATYPAIATRFDTVQGGYVGSAVWWSLEDYWTDVPGITIERFGLYRPDGSERPVAGLARAAFGTVTGPSAPVAGVPSHGRGLSAPAAEATHLALYLAYALLFPVVLMVAIVAGLLWLRRRRLTTRRFHLESST
jgi:hypothetical protein